MLERIARWSYRHRWTMLGIWIAGLVVFIGLAKTTGGSYSNDFSLPGTESQEAYDLLSERFEDRAGWSADIVFKADGGVADPEVQEAMSGLFEEFKSVNNVVAVETPYDEGFERNIAPSGDIAFGTILFEDLGAESLPQATTDRILELSDQVEEETDGLVIEPGGNAIIVNEFEEPGGAEMIGILAAMIILLITFGSFIAMGLPILSAMFGIGIGISLVFLSANFLSVPDFTPQLASMIGIGVGIDYALLIVTRFRQHLHVGNDPESAVVTALVTAGRSVVFAGTIVVISFLGILLMGFTFVEGIAVGGAAAVFVTMLASLTLLPAMLGFAGTNIDRWSLPMFHALDEQDETRMAYRWSRLIQRRPVTAGAIGLLTLLLLTVPLFAMRLGQADAGTAPESTKLAARVRSAERGVRAGLQRTVPPGDRTGFARTARRAERDRRAAAGDRRSRGGYAHDTQSRGRRGDRDGVPPDVAAEPGNEPPRPQPAGRGASGGDGRDRPQGPRWRGYGQHDRLLGEEQRAPSDPHRGRDRPVLHPADDRFPIDRGSDQSGDHEPASIGAAYGVLVAIFQWGWGKSLFGVDATAPIEAWAPMMLFTILFGLSMDYEIFLLSHVREEYVRTKDNAEAVANGLAATARVITAAASIMITIFLSFVFGFDDRAIKLFGLGLAVAIAVDATIVRMILVPATMELLGDANWWLPKWLEPDHPPRQGGGRRGGRCGGRRGPGSREGERREGAGGGAAARRRLPARHATAPLEEDHVAPFAIQLSKSLSSSDHPEALPLEQGETRVILGKDPGLQRPDVLALGVDDQGSEQLRAHPHAACTFGHIDADLGDAGIGTAVRCGAQGGPPDDLVSDACHQPAMAQVLGVPRLPRRC